MTGILGTIGPLIIFFAIFYLLLIRPQQKRQKQVRQMQTDLKKGDRIVTIGGLHGTVDTIEDDRVTIKCNGTTKLTFDRSSIKNVTEESKAVAKSE